MVPLKCSIRKLQSVEPQKYRLSEGGGGYISQRRGNRTDSYRWTGRVGVWNGMIKCAGRRKRDMKEGIWRNTAKIEDHLRGCIKA